MSVELEILAVADIADLRGLSEKINVGRKQNGGCSNYLRQTDADIEIIDLIF
jgi:hypothetical protein